MLRFRLLVFISSFFIAFGAYSQKIKYKDYKDIISLENYREIIITEKYSPLVAGVFSYIIPGSGYFYVREPLRGALVLGSELITISMFQYGLFNSFSHDSADRRSFISPNIMMFAGAIATVGIQIWSINDVVKIAKIKNLVYQEKKITMELRPDFLFKNEFANNSTTYGLRLSINF